MLGRGGLCGVVLCVCACGGVADNQVQEAVELEAAGAYQDPLSACGSGLYCRGYAIAGASACLAGTATIYCCPSGQTITANDVCSGVSTPPCGSGLYCAGNPIPGSTACLSGSVIGYCCPAGQTIVNGACSGSSTVPACGWGLYCAVNAIAGSAACQSGSQTLYCCPSGQTINNGACSGSSTGSGFCSTSCGCDSQGNNCNFGVENTDNWCKCCAENCGNNQAACFQRGYKGDQGFPAGTSRQCGCLRKINDHDFVLADNANLSACYSNLRSRPDVTGNRQTIWHPGVSNCSTEQHMHIDPTYVASSPYNFGIDCLGQATWGGGTCAFQNVSGHGSCSFLWQGAR